MSATIRRASPEEAEELSRVALRAKGHWGYSAEQLNYWRDKFLTVSREYIGANQVWVAEIDSCVVGFAAVEEKDAGAELDHLWVLPEHVGKGVGKMLLGAAIKHVEKTGGRELTLTSDPHADGFYLKMGADKMGVHYSEFQRRKLTKFRILLGSLDRH